MANTDQFPGDLQIHQWQRPDAPNPRLAGNIESTTTTITVTAPFKDNNGAIIDGNFLFGVKNASGYVETIYAPPTSVSPDGLTITGCVRGVRLGGLDYTTGDPALATAHEQDSPVYANISALLFQMMISAMTGGIASGGLSWKIGNGTDGNVTVIAYNADTNKPFFRYDAATDQWVYSNDGVSSTPFGTGAGLVGGDGITINAGIVSVDLSSVNTFVNSSSGVADAGKGIILDGAGKLDSSLFPANLASSAVATDMTYGENLVATDAVSFLGNQKVAKSVGSTLNSAFLFAGVAQANGADNDIKKVAINGVVTIDPAFTLTNRVNCRMWDGQVNNTSNTTSDSLNNTTQRRAQTFTPSAGEDNVAGFILNVTNSTFSGVLTCGLFATSGGVPTGAALASVTKASADVVTGDNEFIFATPIAVTPGVVYACVFWISTYTSGSLAWNYQNTDVYAGGQRCTSSDSGATWTGTVTTDCSFRVRYRGIAGEPVYVSNTTGKLSLTPGTYGQQVGVALSTNKVILSPRQPQIYATYSFSSSSGTVDTEIFLGFRPRRLTCMFNGQIGSSGRVGLGMWSDGSQVGGLTMYNVISSSSWTAFVTTGIIGLLDVDTGAGATVQLSVQAVSGESITIRRVDGGSWGTVGVYLFIEG